MASPIRKSYHLFDVTTSRRRERLFPFKGLFRAWLLLRLLRAPWSHPRNMPPKKKKPAFKKPPSREEAALFAARALLADQDIRLGAPTHPSILDAAPLSSSPRFPEC